MRQRRVEAIRDAMSRSRYVEIRGEAGVGKSGVLRRLAEDLSAEAQVLVLSPNRVIQRGWLSMKAAIGYEGSGRDLMNDLSLSGAAVVFIDSLDFFAAEEKTSVRDIVRFAAQVPDIWVIATARVEFAKTEPNWLPDDALMSLGQTDPVLIEELDDTEVNELKERAHRLSELLSDSHPAQAIVRTSSGYHAWRIVPIPISGQLPKRRWPSSGGIWLMAGVTVDCVTDPALSAG